MSDYLDDNRTEGPEGYFIESPARIDAAGRPRRERTVGRRQSDVELRRSRQRLIWAYAAVSTMFVVAVLMAVTAWGD